jgi:hypothetical protein
MATQPPANGHEALRSSGLGVDDHDLCRHRRGHQRRSLDNYWVGDFSYPFTDPNARQPTPDLGRILAQLGSSAHALRHSLASSVRPLNREEVRSLANSLDVGVEALQSVAPVALTAQIEEIRTLLTDVSRELDAS